MHFQERSFRENMARLGWQIMQHDGGPTILHKVSQLLILDGRLSEEGFFRVFQARQYIFTLFTLFGDI